jgi:lysine/ornithine N-monooxygenase
MKRKYFVSNAFKKNKISQIVTETSFFEDGVTIFMPIASYTFMSFLEWNHVGP